MEEKLARDPGSVGDLYSGGTSPTPSRNPTLGLNLVPTLIFAPVPAPTPPPVPTNELFREFMKTYLELN